MPFTNLLLHDFNSCRRQVLEPTDFMKQPLHGAVPLGTCPMFSKLAYEPNFIEDIELFIRCSDHLGRSLNKKIILTATKKDD